jgi:hypothetical protein
MPPGFHAQLLEHGFESFFRPLLRCETAPFEVAIFQSIGGMSNIGLSRLEPV